MMQTRFLRFLCIFLFLFCTASTFAQNWDIDVLKGINPSVPDSNLWRVMSSSVSVLVIGLPAGIYLINHFRHNAAGKQQALHIAGSIFTSMVLTQLIKYTVNRNRPYITYPLDVFPLDNSEQGLSFPSQHTSFAFATAAILGLRYRKWWVVLPAFGWAFMAGYSRLYLGQHYPTDVMAGAVLGTGSAFLSEWLTKKFWPERG